MIFMLKYVGVKVIDACNSPSNTQKIRWIDGWIDGKIYNKAQTC